MQLDLKKRRGGGGWKCPVGRKSEWTDGWVTKEGRKKRGMLPRDYWDYCTRE